MAKNIGLIMQVDGGSAVYDEFDSIMTFNNKEEFEAMIVRLFSRFVRDADIESYEEVIEHLEYGLFCESYWVKSEF